MEKVIAIRKKKKKQNWGWQNLVVIPGRVEGIFAVDDHERVMVTGAVLSNFPQHHSGISVQIHETWIIGFMGWGG